MSPHLPGRSDPSLHSSLDSALSSGNSRNSRTAWAANKSGALALWYEVSLLLWRLLLLLLSSHHIRLLLLLLPLFLVQQILDQQWLLLRQRFSLNQSLLVGLGRVLLDAMNN